MRASTNALHIINVPEIQCSSANGKTIFDVRLLGTTRIAIAACTVCCMGRNCTGINDQIASNNFGTL